MKEVYVLKEYGIYDCEEYEETEVFDSFDKALERYNTLVENAKEEWDIDDDDIVIENNISKDSANFSIYLEGWYGDRNHNIEIEKKKVK